MGMIDRMLKTNRKNTSIYEDTSFKLNRKNTLRNVALNPGKNEKCAAKTGLLNLFYFYSTI